MMIRSLLIINQFLLLREFSRNVKEKAKCNIGSNGSAIPKINQPGNRRKIFWIKVLSNILSLAKSEISENVVCSMFESQFSICFILHQCCGTQQRRLMLCMRFKEQQFSQKTIPKLVRTRERSMASWAPLQVVVY